VDIHTATTTEKRNSQAVFEEIRKAIEAPHDYAAI
jgi:hypothetical protein